MFLRTLFLFSCLLSENLLAQELSYAQVIETTTQVVSQEKYIGSLSENSLHHLPVGIVREIGGARYVIAVDSARFFPQDARFHAYMAVEFPGTDHKMAFAAKNVSFTPAGIAGGTGSRLMLVSEHQIDWGEDRQLTLAADGSNWVEWDCNGFSGIHLHGVVRFSTSVLIPTDGKDQVEASFTFYGQDLNSLIAGIQLSPFTLKGMEDWKFSVTEAVLDLSQNMNHPSMIFPLNYQGEKSNWWTGFFLRQLQISMPREFNHNDNPTTFTASNVLMDESGICGIFSAENFMGNQKGDMSGWRFSIDKLAIHIQQNRFYGGEMDGEIDVPLFDSSNRLQFHALLLEDNNHNINYNFSLNPAENVRLHAFNATTEIYSSSSISVIRFNGKFKPELLLNGKIEFGDQDFSSGKIDFNQLRFTTLAPYISGGYFGYSDRQPSFANYPVSIDSIGVFIAPNGAPAVGMHVLFQLGNDEVTGVSSSARMEIRSRVEGGNYRFDGVYLDDLFLAAHTQAFSMDGSLRFFRNDPDYGRGFFGQLDVKIPNVIESPLSLQACFGTSTFRYFALDAFVPVHIPIGTTPLIINRLIGGVSHKMRPTRTNAAQSNLVLYNPPATPRTQLYFPDPGYGTIFRAGAGLAFSPNEKSFNGDVMLEVAFNSNGGLDQVSLNGNGYFLSSVAERQQKPASVYGTVSLLYDVPEKTFDASMQASLRVPNAVQGNASVHMHFDPQNWSVAIGRPTQPAQVNVLNFASANAYFLMGKNLEPMAPVPSLVQPLVSSNQLDAMRNPQALEDASGVAMGMSLGGGMYREVGWDFFTVYGSFSYGAGFDMMMADFGASAHCSGSTDRVGWNGKIIEGRLYAFLQGNIGVKGEFSGHDFDLIILSGNVAALLEGRLPHPTWLHGAVRCEYEILSVIRGDLELNMELGENCQIQTQ
ncbi:MAG: hypothetical protein K1X56_05035 [Flavobacteriales bacterium]|nr:hypothetical protein [Flavobacteriales bacterium]